MAQKNIIYNMKIKKFESNLNRNIECSDLILDIFGDMLSISNIKFLDDVEYNFQCKISSITDKSYNNFKVLFDVIKKNSNDFIITGTECFAKIYDVDNFCDDIRNVKI